MDTYKNFTIFKKEKEEQTDKKEQTVKKTISKKSRRINFDVKDMIENSTQETETGEQEMAKFSKFNSWLNGAKNYDPKSGQVEYYEDTHDNRGEYIGSYAPPSTGVNYTQTNTMRKTASRPLPSNGQQIAPRNYQNVVVYEPKTPEDVQTLIDYLKRREPAIINLDNIDMESAQRILDFVSGAIYALNGSVHRVANNIFLLSPEGVEITVPYDL